MEEYSVGTDVTIDVAHSYNGVDLTLTDLQFQVLDAQGAILADYATPGGFNPTDTSTSITIDSAYNLSSEKIDVRQVNVKLVTAAGTYINSIFYKLLGDLTKLTVMSDSFMTFPESIVTRAKMSEKLEWFDALTDPMKATALTNSFESIYKMGFKQITTTTEDTPLYINAYTETQFRSLPGGMQLALKRAQIAQANAMVENSPIREKIRNGIISETIGESSMFFKQTAITGTSKFPGLADEAYHYLSEYLYRSATSAQIWKVRRA